jgi:heat shock protein 1/8
MLSDANKFRAEDNKQRERVNAKNKLERYVFRLRDACDKELKWLDANQTGDKEEYEYRYNELSKKCSPKTASTNHLYVEID